MIIADDGFPLTGVRGLRHTVSPVRHAVAAPATVILEPLRAQALAAPGAEPGGGRARVSTRAELVQARQGPVLLIIS